MSEVFSLSYSSSTAATSSSCRPRSLTHPSPFSSRRTPPFGPVSCSPFATPGRSPSASPARQARSRSKSPRVWPPSSPRVESIPSVDRRVVQLFRSGKANPMMKNASLSEKKAKIKEYQKYLHSYDRSRKKSSKNALLQMDRYLRRRHAFQLFDVDMVMKGKVCNKIDVGIVITIIDVDPSTVRLNTKYYSSSQLSSESTEKDDAFQDIEELAIEGICQICEIESGETEILSSRSSDIIDRFSLGDVVKALVISVDVHSEKLYLSLNNARLRGMPTQGRLGLVPKSRIQRSINIPADLSRNKSNICSYNKSQGLASSVTPCSSSGVKSGYSWETYIPMESMLSDYGMSKASKIKKKKWWEEK